MDASCDVVSSTWQGWHQIDWSSAHLVVGGLQARIAKAARLGDWRKARQLQRLLTRSSSAKALAVKRVTENRGRKTPGVDGATWSTPDDKWSAVQNLKVTGYRPKPLRRVHIPKANGGQRPLGIPTMTDRAMQALFLLGLEPVAETTADPNSYGFRPQRSTADAMAQCRNALGRRHSPQWVLDADIKGCFDNIDHDWLMGHIPLEKDVLKRWLKAGVVDTGRLFPTEAGTPQGGIISPVLANMTLDGLERLLKGSLPRRAKVNFVRYADDFIITGVSREILEAKVIPLVEAFLSTRGLRLSPEKTRIVQIKDGFDFLGWQARKYQERLLVRPSKKNGQAFYRKIADTLKELRTATQAEVIQALNPIIRGWGAYHRSQNAKRTFAQLDHRIFWALWRWAKRRHPRKGRRWIREKYFRKGKSRTWVFALGTEVLARLSDIKIVSHVKITAEANPFDPEWETYYEERLKGSMSATLTGKRKLMWLWTQQEGICPQCGQKVTRATGWNVHHVVYKAYGGTDKMSNLRMLHPNCHRQLHSQERAAAA
ncbi:MAG: group II intron reverse transcriptase/maturase [Chromatiaceae bacterium]